MCSAVGDMKTCFLVREGTWNKGEGRTRARGTLAPGVLRRASPPKRDTAAGASGKGGHGRPCRIPEPWPR